MTISTQEDARKLLTAIVDNVARVIIGKNHVIELALVCLLCKGHVLIEDVPGVGKTSLASALAKSMDCSFKRVQFTPDIMPSDLVGFSMLQPQTGEFVYRPGAVMSQFILADEINRTSPKTQSSLLEVMEENQVTVDGVTYRVPQPFMVLATQNPVEYLGTYPLPEAQLDRFFMKISVGYPSREEESQMLNRFRHGSPLATLSPVASGPEVLAMQEQALTIRVDEAVNQYIVSLVTATRDLGPYVLLGASPRASLCLYKAAQAWALLNGRDYAVPDDVWQMAQPVLEHRILLKQEAKLKKVTAAEMVTRALEAVKMPI